MAQKTGRNDPCPCGSGKKYKKCCLAADEQRAAAQRPVPAEAPAPSEASGGEPADLQETPSFPRSIREICELLRKVTRTGTAAQRAEFKEMVAETGPLLTYLERQQEIEQAAAALEPYRQEYAALKKREDVYLQRAQALFAEERFASLRFTAAEVRRALEQVGYSPALPQGNRQTMKKLKSAILSLADKDRRNKMALVLNLQLPELVTAGRPLDALLVEECAFRTMEDTNESNPFLFQMFAQGYDAWVREREAGGEAMLREIGLSPEQIRGMSLDEIDAWLRAQMADPAKDTLLEKVFEAHPEQHQQAIAEALQMERDCIKLLQRKDAKGLLLPVEEMKPWLPVLNERWAPLLSSFAAQSSNRKKDKLVKTGFAETVWPTMGEMAQSFYTPERIERLVAQLRQYRNERFADGNKDVAAWAQAAIGSLEREREPGENYFLRAICYQSLGPVFDSVANNS